MLLWKPGELLEHPDEQGGDTEEAEIELGTDEREFGAEEERPAGGQLASSEPYLTEDLLSDLRENGA